VILHDAAGGRVYVAGLGASTAVGRDAWSSAAAVRAGISGFAEHPYMIDTAGQPMRVAFAPWVEFAIRDQARFEALLVPAIEQAFAPIEAARELPIRVALALALPEARPGLPTDLDRCLRVTLERRFAHRFAALAAFEIGHAAGFAAMHAALEKIAAGAFDACIVAGVESYLTPQSLEWLEETDQFHGAGPLNNAWGFVPGEGAGAVLLAGERAMERLEAEPLARVLSVGSGYEHNRIKTETVCIGEGLTAAFRETLAGLPRGVKVTDVFCDLNGEPYRADEFGFACLRSKEAFESPSDFVAPAECWGDVSAASAPLSLMLAAIAFKKGYARGRYALIWASSENGERGAGLLELIDLG
jgi:3-oxoacyl-[acyl-carrier-protein] synthase-1